MAKINFISESDLLSICSVMAYDKETGLFTWTTEKYKRKGEVAGSYDRKGYCKLKLNYKHFQAHRLAYFLSFGLEYQGYEIDHIDGNTSNNKLSNLRLASSSQNATNKKLNSNSKTKVKNVYFDNKKNRFVARITKLCFIDGVNKKKTLYKKQFLTLAEAEIAVKNKRIELFGDFANHG